MKLNIALVLMLVMAFALVFTGIPVVNAHWPSEFEQFGPHVDQILIKLYANEQLEFAALEAGEIDLIDSPLTKYWIDRWTGNPEINMMGYDYLGAFEIDINNNETARGVDNIGRLFGFRHALAHLVDRDHVVSTIMGGWATPLYTMVPPALGSYLNPNVDKHPYNPAEAANILDAAGIVDTDGDGFRDWPGTSNHAEVYFVVRDDHTSGRKEIGDRVIWELTTNLPGAKFYVYRISAPNVFLVRNWVTVSKRFTLYTGGWTLNRDPDYLFSLYHSSMYWHPGVPPNYCNIHDSELDGYLEGIKYAENFYDARVNTQEAQRIMAEKCFVIPTYIQSSPKAGRMHYTGGTDGHGVVPDDGENIYRGKAWRGFVNEAGKGLNSWWTFLDAHPDSYELSPDSVTKPMRIRYGFSMLELSSLNPVYSEWYWEWEMMGKVYDNLFAVNPFDLSEDLEAMADRWETFVYDNNGSPATELVFALRNDIYFHDGVQLTADDIYFTFVELTKACEARELPYPWYYSNLLDVNSIIIENSFKVRVRMNSLSVFAFHWIGGNIILPRHIWGPIMMGPDMIIGTADDDTYDPETFSPDKQLIGSGPFKAYPHSIHKADNDYYIPGVEARLDGYKGYWGFTPDKKTGGVAQVAWNIPGYLSVWKLNFHLYLVQSKEYIVIGDGSRPTQWKWWDNAAQTWVTGSAPTLPPNPPEGIAHETDIKPPATGTPYWAPGNKPGIFIKYLPVPAGTFTTLVKYVVVLEQDTTLDTSATYPWRKYEITKPQPSTEIQGDINDDSRVDVLDAVLLAVHYGLRPWVWTEIDVNEDEVINLADASIVIRDWTG